MNKILLFFISTSLLRWALISILKKTETVRVTVYQADAELVCMFPPRRDGVDYQEIVTVLPVLGTNTVVQPASVKITKNSFIYFVLTFIFIF